MGTHLRVLIVEDSDDDAHLVAKELEEGGYDLHWERVETKNEMVSALRDGEWDIVITDYTVPNFGALEALKVVQDRMLNIPFIVVNGTIGQETAVETMKAGAHDYIMKDNLARLVPVVRREPGEASIRRGRKHTRYALEESEKRYRTLVDNSLTGIYVRRGGRILFANRRFCKMLGYPKRELLQRDLFDIIHPEDREPAKKRMLRREAGEKWIRPAPFRVVTKDGDIRWIQGFGTVIEYQGTTAVLGNIIDITERKEAEEALEQKALLEDLITTISTNFINLPPDGIEDGINHALHKIGTFSDVDRSYIFLLNESGTEMSNTHEWCARGIEPQIDRLKDVPVKTFSWIMTRINEGDVVHIPCIEDLPAEAEAERGELELEGIKSLIIVPMLSEGKVIGFLGFDSVRAEKAWNDAAISLLRMAGQIFTNALERQRVEEALRESEGRYRTLVDNSLTAIYIRRGNKFEFVNERLASGLGYSREELMQKGFLDLVHPDERDTAREAATQRASGILSTSPSQYRLRKRNGETMWVEVFGTPIEFDGGTAVLANCIDITERKRAEEALRESEERYRTLVESAADIICMIDMKTVGIASVNSAVQEILGYTKEEILNADSFLDLVHPEDQEKVAVSLREALVDDTKHPGFHFRLRKSDDTYIDVDEEGAILRDSKGELVHYLTIVRDVTDQKRAEVALRESEARYRTLFENNPIQIVVVDSDGVVTASNKPARASAIPLPKVGDRIYVDYTDNNKHDMRAELMNSIVSGTSKEFPELRYGNSFLSIKISPFPGGAIIISEDISARKRAEKRLQESYSLIAAAFDSTPDGILVVDTKGNMLSSNRRFLEMWQIPERVMATHDDFEVRAHCLRRLKTVQQEVENVGEMYAHPELERLDVLEFKDGQILERYARPQKIGGETVGIVQYYRDVTERTLAERTLLGYQRRLRSLASELSLAEERERRRIADELHDQIGQALLASKIKLGTLRKSVSNPSFATSLGETYDLLEQTIKDVRSLTFKLSPPILYMLGFEAAVEWLVEENEKQFGIVSKFERDEWPKPLSDDIRVLLFQNVRELLLNVAKHSRATAVKVSIRRHDGTVAVDVEDDGVGFDPKRLGSHWDGSSGFGLFSIRERLTYLGGNLAVNSRPGIGTRITLTVPIKQEERENEDETA